MGPPAQRTRSLTPSPHHLDGRRVEEGHVRHHARPAPVAPRHEHRAVGGERGGRVVEPADGRGGQHGVALPGRQVGLVQHGPQRGVRGARVAAVGRVPGAPRLHARTREESGRHAAPCVRSGQGRVPRSGGQAAAVRRRAAPPPDGRVRAERAKAGGTVGAGGFLAHAHIRHAWTQDRMQVPTPACAPALR